MRRRSDSVKRAVDVIVSALGLIATAPLLAAIALVILLTHGRPAFFRQVRPGRGGEAFELVKFRTMLPPSDTRRSDAERLTGIGRFLRSTSLDELPSLINVLRGDMSLVGPRPLLVEYLERYTPEQARRHEVRPGVTGLAQINGRNAISWEEKFRFDVHYVDHRSLLLDLVILAGTVKAVLRRTGINENAHVTMSEFLGNAEASPPTLAHPISSPPDSRPTE